MKNELDDEDARALRRIRVARMHEAVQVIEADPSDLESLDQMESFCESLKMLGLPNLCIVASEDCCRQSATDVQVREVLKPPVTKTDADDILAAMAKRGLSEANEKKLKAYFDYRSESDGFKRDFVQDYAASRSVRVHKDDDRVILAYAIAAISLLVSMVPSLITLGLRVWAGAFLAVSVGLLINSLVRKGSKKRMEDFYRYISRHEESDIHLV